MKINNLFSFLTGIFIICLLANCNNAGSSSAPATEKSAATEGGQSAVQDDVSQKDVVKVAAGSPDHTTLVAAVKAADLVNALSNAGPFTVFAPVNAAFDKLPAGTVQDLLKPEKKEALQDVLQYHVAVGVYKVDMLRDGQQLSMANGGNVTVGVQGGKVTINGANIIATVPASNGIVHVIDAVLLPK